MKISLTIISIILVLSVFLPFILFVYNGAKNTTSIKKQAQTLIKSNGIIYSLQEVWRQNFIGISNDNTVVTYIQFNSEKPASHNINLKDVKQCHIIKNYNDSALKNLSLEIIYKSSGASNSFINFFNIDDDLNEDFELQRIEKWHTLIKNAITEPQVAKIAS